MKDSRSPTPRPAGRVRAYGTAFRQSPTDRSLRAKEQLAGFDDDAESHERATEIVAHDPAARFWAVGQAAHGHRRRGNVTAKPGIGSEDLLRQLAPQVLGALVRRCGHFDLSEDAVQEALLAATLQWPDQGVPENPRGWLITVAARRLTDELRSDQARRRREEKAAAQVSADEHFEPVSGRDLVLADEDDTLTLFFLCAHPALSPASQLALTLRAVGGLTTTEIARAFLVPETTIAQRISRAKQSIKGSGIPFSLPPEPERAARLQVALDVLYLIFNEGYTAFRPGPATERADVGSHPARPRGPETASGGRRSGRSARAHAAH